VIGGSKDTDIRVDAQEQCIARGILLGVTDMAGSPESVAEARDYVRQKLGTGHPAVDDVTLLTSELVTNSVIHSNSRNGGSVTLALADCHDFIHVDVVDSGGDTVPCVRGDVLAEGGRGLMLVDLLSQRWGVYEDDAGRTVWFEVAYTRGGDPGHGVFVPGNANRREPTEEQVRAVRETSATACRTVADSVEADRRHQQARRLIERWNLDREGLDQAAASFGIPPLADEEICP
jgi:anti-sigma regulatory factor (Ser/Thr protein kinase)